MEVEREEQPSSEAENDLGERLMRLSRHSLSPEMVEGEIIDYTENESGVDLDIHVLTTGDVITKGFDLDAVWDEEAPIATLLDIFNFSEGGIEQIRGQHVVLTSTEVQHGTWRIVLDSEFYENGRIRRPFPEEQAKEYCTNSKSHESPQSRNSTNRGTSRNVQGQRAPQNGTSPKLRRFLTICSLALSVSLASAVASSVMLPIAEQLNPDVVSLMTTVKNGGLILTAVLIMVFIVTSLLLVKQQQRAT